jgi:hypothetical protein
MREFLLMKRNSFIYVLKSIQVSSYIIAFKFSMYNILLCSLVISENISDSLSAASYCRFNMYDSLAAYKNGC